MATIAEHSDQQSPDSRYSHWIMPRRGRASAASRRRNDSGRPRWFLDLSATVESYRALTFASLSPVQAVLATGRPRIDASGGIHRVKTYPKFSLALFGLYDWEGVAPPPPPTHVPGRSLR